MESRPTPTIDPTAEPTSSLAEDLPGLYRAILERVAELEQAGSRLEAGRIRASATAAYSNAWDESARRALTGLRARADRKLAEPARGRTWPLRRRSPAAR
jgi:hypothetical protein